jgi:hypothetical protein
MYRCDSNKREGGSYERSDSEGSKKTREEAIRETCDTRHERVGKYGEQARRKSPYAPSLSEVREACKSISTRELEKVAGQFSLLNRQKGRGRRRTSSPTDNSACAASRKQTGHSVVSDPSQSEGRGWLGLVWRA